VTFDENSLAEIIKQHQTSRVRITIDIDETVLKDAMRLTGERKKGPAIAKATREFVRRQMAREFGRRLMDGDFGDYPMTNDEIEDYDR
jgi:Arc/MetJ family transcription regulator